MAYGLRRIETNDTIIGQVVNPDLSGKVKVIDRTASNLLKSHEYTELFNSDPIDIQDRLFDDKKAELFAEELKKKDAGIDYMNQRIKEDQTAKRTKKQKAEQAYRDALSNTPDVIDSMAAAATEPQSPIDIKIKSSSSDDNPESSHEPKGPVGRPPQMYDISGSSKGNKAQAKKEEAQIKREEKAQAKKEADDLKLLNKEIKALEKKEAKELTVKERINELEKGTTVAQKVASAAVSGVKKLGSLASASVAGVQHLASSSSSSVQPRDTSLLYGTGKKDFYIPNTLPIDTSLLYGTANTKAKPKPKSKASKTMDQEYEDLMDDVRKNKPKPKPKPKASASAPVKKTGLKTKNVTTGTQILPSRIGIQKLREELENAKNKGKLDAQDTSAYMKMYDDWKAAKGDKALKDEKLKGLREICKRVIYTK